MYQDGGDDSFASFVEIMRLPTFEHLQIVH